MPIGCGRYKALLVEGSGNGYLKRVCDYVHLNPVRAGLLKSEDPLRAYPWSSLGSEAFRQEMLERMRGQLGEDHAGDLRRKMGHWPTAAKAVRASRRK